MNDETRWYLLNQKKFEVEIVQAFQLFRCNNIEPILIKGWAAARFYPIDVLRYYDDIDLAVSFEDYDAALLILDSEEGRKLGIDLHCEFRHLDTRPWKTVYNNSRLVPLNDTGIRVPSAEDHLRVLCVHWLNDGGAKKERLSDIYYAVENRHEDFDWDLCLNSVSDRRRQWIVSTIGLAHKYLGLKIDDLPFADQARVPPLWLIREVEREWENGVPLRSLHTCLNDRKEFVRQMRKRLPPNAIQATIEMEGSFNDGSRLYYQLGSILKRTLPSLRGLYGRINRTS